MAHREKPARGFTKMALIAVMLANMVGDGGITVERMLEQVPYGK